MSDDAWLTLMNDPLYRVILDAVAQAMAAQIDTIILGDRVDDTFMDRQSGGQWGLSDDLPSNGAGTDN